MSKNYDEATKAFYSNVSGRTRSKGDAYGITYYSSHVPSHGSAGVSAPNREKKKRKQLKPALSVQRPKSSVNKRAKEPMIEIVDESELIRKKARSASEIRRPTMPRSNKGYDNEDSDSEGIEIIDNAYYMSQNSCSMSKIRSSTKEKLNASLSAATPRKYEDAWPHESRSFIQLGSDSEDTKTDNFMVRRMDEARFRNPKSKYESKIQQSAINVLCTSCGSKSFGGAKKNVSCSAFSVTAKANCTGSDVFADNLSAFGQKGKKSKPMSSIEIKGKGNNKCESKNGKSRSTTSKRGAFTYQRYSAVGSRKNAKEECVDSYCGSSSEDVGRDSHKEQADLTRSLTDTASSDGDIETVDESEWKRRKCIAEAGPSNRQEPNKGHFAATSAKNVKSVSRKSVRDIVDSSSSSEFLDSSSSSESDSNEVDFYKQHADASSCGPGVASRTRSKIGNVDTQTNAGNLISSSSTDSDSLPTDSGYHCNDEDLEVERSDDGIEVLGSNINLSDVINKTTKASAETIDCSKEESGAQQSKQLNCEETTPMNQNFSPWKRQLRDDEIEVLGSNINLSDVCNKSMKVSAETRDCSKEESVAEQSKQSNKLMKVSAETRDCSKEESVAEPNKLMKVSAETRDCSKKESVAEQSKQSNKSMKVSAETRDCSKEESVAEQTKQSNNEQPAPSNQKFSPKKRPLRAERDANKPKLPIGRQEVHKCNDLFSMLADDVLGRRQLPKNDESHEEEKQPSTSQIQETLPLKFRFEDEVPPVVEKTESEKELEDLFYELDCSWALEELRSFDYHKVDLGNGKSHAEETQHARCCRGEHALVIEDDQGLFCKFCHHVELGPKDLLPEWAARTYRESERRQHHEKEQPLELDELNIESPINTNADFDNSGSTVWSLKPGVRGSMYEHQQEGFEFLWQNLAGSINLDELQSSDPSEVGGGCIISHAPGTGKTRLTIVFLETYLKRFPNCRPMIIGPASMLLTWEDEFRKWDVEFPFLNLSNVELSAKEKVAVGSLARAKSRDNRSIRMIKIYSWSKGRSILGISYSLFEKLTAKKGEAVDSSFESMRTILLEKPGLVVLDEGHTPRNQRSSIWNVLQKLQTRKRVILSGTPFQNNFGELFNTLRIVRPAVADVIAQQKTFAEMVAARRRRSRGGGESSSVSQVINAAAVEKLKICMLPFVHVHKGTILQKSLPGLRDCIVLLKPSTLQKSLIERIEGSNNFKFEHDIALISVHPYLFRNCESREDQRVGIDMAAVEASKLNPQEGVKTRFIMELVRLSIAVNEKVLIFSQFIQPLQLIKDQLKEHFNWWAEGRQILQMQGNVELKQRQLLINQFNDPLSESKVMLASTKCCSEGISLIGASRVVLVDVVWNPSVERQAISRAYRIGQKKFVYTYHLMTDGTTEADKYCRQAEKERLSELVFSSTSESNQLKQNSAMEDRLLEVMVRHKDLRGMFEKIISQPKDTDLIQTFGLTS